MNAHAESTKRSDRIAARVPHGIKENWIRAAELRGQSLTDFVIVAANAMAVETFREHERIELSRQDQIKLAEMLINPPELSERMKQALKKRMSSAGAE
ncbi:DUF1778 domain-containing protein [Synergistaceae bacterium OttesenSCG-928-D05]|nr:DUF1778 domain-containing protein [Synergistaceae bacterium OttesenSCG-928-D05]